MATYSSYKQIDPVEIQNGTLTDTQFATDALKTYGVKWVFGSPGDCTGGCCCLWTVPSYVTNVTFELWSAGGNGAGACSYNRCQHFQGAGGGNYSSKTISTAPGCQYTVCAGGVYPCKSVECVSCFGCSSYVNGYNLSNYCVCGGAAACSNSDWNTYCFAEWTYCLSRNHNGADMTLEPMRPAFSGANVFCHCHNQEHIPQSAPLIGTYVYNQIRECWMRCGCWTSPYGHGGSSAMSTYCGSDGCCGQGATGGSGLVKITYI